MSNLSDLLNPSAEEDAQPGRKDSIPPLHIPANPYNPSGAPQEQGQYSSHPSQGSNAVHTLAALSSSIGTPSSSQQQRTSASPPGQHQHRSSVDRRMSAYEEGVNSAGLPRAGELLRKSSSGSQQYETQSPESILRKMSSPTLHHYHMSSRSPEQTRRASMIVNPDPSFKLPPLQHNLSPTLSHQQPSRPPHNQENVSYSQLPETLSKTPSNVEDSSAAHTEAIPHVHSPVAQGHAAKMPSLDNITSGGPSPNATNQATLTQQPTPSLEERRSSTTPIKSEGPSSIRDSIPAFVPVSQIKKESSMTSTPMREESVPMPSTEDNASGEARGVKRPAPKTKKGVAKKGPPAKKQKVGTNGDTKTKSKPKSAVKRSGNGTPLDSSPAPRSARAASSIGRSSGSPEFRESEGEEEEAGSPDDGEYCICRKGDNGTFMIGCDGKCDDWFHGKCVGILEKDKNLIDRYICPNCTDAGVGVTTWKRMCRRVGCRMPARLAKKDEEPSKYCSEECGITFFRDMMGRTRGASDVSGGKKSRRQSATGPQEDVGPRGGAISQAELKSMLNAVATVDEFKRLGEGVLSPPATPSPKLTKASTTSSLDDTETKRILEINKTKDELRARHALLKDQARFVGMLRQRSAQIAEDKGMKPKDLCGYDDRVRMDEAAFAKWRDSEEGKAALKAGDLAFTAVKSEDGDGVKSGKRDSVGSDICTRKKCPKHYEWAKLSLETNRSEMGENSERMRSLEREEKEIKERAGLRARQIKAGDFGGKVEIHGVEVSKKEGSDEAKGLGIGVDGEGAGLDTNTGASEVAPETAPEAPTVATTEAMDTSA
ncbi:hypothetical protein KVT40_001664 [Elsinoe batatas]|uniref:PHD-type domain-containing protein n=1 Tax=Elsinoe batatas TaxID=2601811 RepID=A0A8K0PF90_9PEZI|nr:hypothetical protein KVT40_001664 [Elsinoe batatas]